MAELVGDAYIRITADTHVMRRALARDMKKAGKDDAGNYVASFSKEVKRTANAKMAGARKSFANALADPKEFDRLATKFKSIESAADHWRKKLRELDAQHKLSGKDMERFTEAVDNWERSAKAARDAAAKLNKEHEEAILINNKATDEWAAHRIELDRNRKALAALQKEEERLARLRQRENDRMRGIRRNVDGDIVGRASAWGRSLDRLDFRLNRFGDKVGKAFGKGKRNNFVNLFGGMVGSIAKMAGKLVSVPYAIGGAFADMFAAAADAWKQTRNIFKAGAAGFGALFKGLASAIPALLAAVGALFLFGKVVPGIVSGLSLLAGAVVATASAISYGLVGALLAVGPAAAGAAAGLGGVFGVITVFMQDKKNKNFVQELFVNPFKRFSKQFYPQIRTFLTGVSGGFKRLIKDLTPSIKTFFDYWETKMGDVDKHQGDVFNKQGKLIKAGKGDLISMGTVTALDKWSSSLGRIANQLNSAVTSFGSGLIGFFVPVLPYAEKLATWIDDIAKRFDEWANSAEGQKSISDFMKTAWADAHKVWQILVDIKDIIFTVFEQSEPTGAGILDGIHAKLKDINRWLKDPDNKGKIDGWFANAGQMAADVGELAGHISDIIRNFNSPEGQKSAKELMTSINQIGDAAGKVSAASDAVGSLFGWVEKLAHFGAPQDANGHGWLHNLIWGEDKPLPKMPEIKPPQIPTKTKEQVFAGRKELVEKYRVTIDPQTVKGKEQLQAIEDFQFSGKTIPIKGNEDLWALMRDSAAAYVFTEKQIVVGADTTEWDKAKGTAAGYVFDPKNIHLTADYEEVKTAVAEAKKWLETLPAVKRIRIAGANSTGGFPVGAAGGYFDKPTTMTIGEAGPEALVPLNRSLSMVDPAVRELSAIAQGMVGPKGLPAANAGPRVNFAEGAIQVNLPTGDPKQAAEAVLDRLVAYIG